MNILVTGGCGFIGHNVVQLLQKDHTVTTYDSYTDYGIIDRDDMDLLLFERFKTITGKRLAGDIRNKERMESAFVFTKPEVVIHLASLPRGKVVNANPVEGADVMSAGLMSLLEFSSKHKVKRFVYISSSMVYGNFNDGATEFDQCYPRGTYAILKYAGELLVRDYCLSHGMEFVIVRPSAVYGPVDVDDRVVAKFFKAAMENKQIVVNGPYEQLDFTYVTDVAQGICLAALDSRAAYNTYNMTRGESHHLLTAAQLIHEITDSTSSILVNPRDESFPSRGALSIRKAQFDLQYNPQIPIEIGFRLYYEWLKN